jgi:urease accessory protein
MKTPAIILAAAALLLSPSLASAHPGHGTGLAEGFLHPFTGIDHLLALLALGVFASRLTRGRALGVVGGFLACFTAAFLAVRGGLVLPAQEEVIAASLLGMGAIMVLGRRMPLALSLAVTGLFAAYHGAAHGGELAGLTLAGTLTGFFLACLLITGAGFAAGRLLLRETPRMRAWRLAAE